MQLHYEEKNWSKFVALKKQIQIAGFSEQCFTWRDPFTNEIGTKTIFNKIRCWGRKPFGTRPSVEFKGTPTIQDDKLKYYNQLHDHFRKVDKFFEKYTKTIWYHKESMKPTAGSDLQKDLKDYNLSEARLSLEKMGVLSQKAIELALKPISANLDKRLKQFEDSQDSKYHTYPKDTPESDAWILREDEAIHKIRELYKEYIRLSDEQIKLNMAHVFKEINFWPHPRKDSSIRSIYDRLTKRFKKIDQMKNKYPEMFPLEK